MSLPREDIYEEAAIAIGIETTMKGDDYISADFEITDDNGEVFTVEWRGWLTEKAEDRTLESLRLMGWTGDDIYGDLIADGALSNKVKIDVRHEEYKGKTTARVAFINGPDLDPAATEKKREEKRERLRRKAKTIKLAEPTKTAEKNPEDDKLPF